MSLVDGVGFEFDGGVLALLDGGVYRAAGLLVEFVAGCAWDCDEDANAARRGVVFGL